MSNNNEYKENSSNNRNNRNNRNSSAIQYHNLIGNEFTHSYDDISVSRENIDDINKHGYTYRFGNNSGYINISPPHSVYSSYNRGKSQSQIIQLPQQIVEMRETTQQAQHAPPHVQHDLNRIHIKRQHILLSQTENPKDSRRRYSPNTNINMNVNINRHNLHNNHNTNTNENKDTNTNGNIHDDDNDNRHNRMNYSEIHRINEHNFLHNFAKNHNSSRPNHRHSDRHYYPSYNGKNHDSTTRDNLTYNEKRPVTTTTVEANTINNNQELRVNQQIGVENGSGNENKNESGLENNDVANGSDRNKKENRNDPRNENDSLPPVPPMEILRHGHIPGHIHDHQAYFATQYISRRERLIQQQYYQQQQQHNYEQYMQHHSHETHSKNQQTTVASEITYKPDRQHRQHINNTGNTTTTTNNTPNNINGTYNINYRENMNRTNIGSAQVNTNTTTTPNPRMKTSFDLYTRPPNVDGNAWLNFLSKYGVSAVERIHDLYGPFETVGSGEFTRVYKTIRKTDNKQVALKVFRKSHRMAFSCFKRELYAIDGIGASFNDNDDSNNNNQHFLQFHSAHVDAKYFYLEFELLDGGDLFSFIEENENILEIDVKHIIFNILEGISIFHKNGFVHRDLKPENIGIKSKENVRDIRIIDFGESIRVNKDKLYHGGIGTAWYLSPERIKNCYGEQLFCADIWAIGIIAFETMFRHRAWEWDESTDIRILYKQISNLNIHWPSDYKKIASNKCINFIKECLNNDPLQRLNYQTALQHEWFDDIRPNENENESKLSINRNVNINMNVKSDSILSNSNILNNIVKNDSENANKNEIENEDEKRFSIEKQKEKEKKKEKENLTTESTTLVDKTIDITKTKIPNLTHGTNYSAPPVQESEKVENISNRNSQEKKESNGDNEYNDEYDNEKKSENLNEKHDKKPPLNHKRSLSESQMNFVANHLKSQKKNTNEKEETQEFKNNSEISQTLVNDSGSNTSTSSPQRLRYSSVDDNQSSTYNATKDTVTDSVTLVVNGESIEDNYNLAEMDQFDNERNGLPNTTLNEVLKTVDNTERIARNDGDNIQTLESIDSIEKIDKITTQNKQNEKMQNTMTSDTLNEDNKAGDESNDSVNSNENDNDNENDNSNENAIAIVKLSE